MAKSKSRNKSRGHAPTVVPPQTWNPEEPVTPTPASQWKSNLEPQGIPLPLPSGNVALVKRVGMEAFMAQGMIPDPLTPIVSRAVNSKKGLRPQDAAKMTTDPVLLGAMVEMADRIAVNAVIEPKMSMPPVCSVCGELDTPRNEQHNSKNHPEFHEHSPGQRDPDVLYVDRVDLEDKLHIMNYAVGGTSDLKQFREQLRIGMGSMATQQGSQSSAQ